MLLTISYKSMNQTSLICYEKTIENHKFNTPVEYIAKLSSFHFAGIALSIMNMNEMLVVIELLNTFIIFKKKRKLIYVLVHTVLWGITTNCIYFDEKLRIVDAVPSII